MVILNDIIVHPWISGILKSRTTSCLVLLEDFFTFVCKQGLMIRDGLGPRLPNFLARDFEQVMQGQQE